MADLLFSRLGSLLHLGAWSCGAVAEHYRHHLSLEDDIYFFFIPPVQKERLLIAPDCEAQHIMPVIARAPLTSSQLASVTQRGLSALITIASNSSDPMPQFAGWTINSGGRGTIDIIWKCFLALAFCCWTSLHLNIPRPNEPSLSRILRKLKWAIIAIIVPEIILTIAIFQRFNASTTLKKLKETGFCDDWRLRHAFFANMGGFKIKTPKKEHVLDRKDFFRLIETGQIPPTISKSKIDELSRSDGLGKTIAVFAGSWLLITTIMRRIESSPQTGNSRLAISPLEVTSSIFVLNILAAYICWWEKPYDVQSSIEWDVSGLDHRDHARGRFPFYRQKLSFSSERVPNFSFANLMKLKYAYAFIPSCIIFGGLHLLVLPAECYFPTRVEKWLWVGNSAVVACTGIFVLITMYFSIAILGPPICCFLCLIGCLLASKGEQAMREAEAEQRAEEGQEAKIASPIADEEQILESRSQVSPAPDVDKDPRHSTDEVVTQVAMEPQSNAITPMKYERQRRGENEKTETDQTGIGLFSSFAAAFGMAMLPVLLVVVARLMLLLLALASLRELDAGVYDTPHWENYLPFS